MTCSSRFFIIFFLHLFSYKCTCFVSCFVNTSIVDDFMFCYMRDKSTLREVKKIEK
jgi:hypothetical protein